MGAQDTLQAAFDVRTLPPVAVVAGHYGVGKTNLAMNLALDARAAGREVVLADVDVVNPYFRSSDYRRVLGDAGVRVIAPVMAGTTLDVPSLTGEVATACAWAREAVAQGAPARLLVVDAGGDDVGATALARYAAALGAGDYALFYVVNACRNLTQDPARAVEVLREIERALRLPATAVANNTHLSDATDAGVVERGVAFAREVARRAELPLAFTTVPPMAADVPLGGEVRYPVQVRVTKPWDEAL